MVLRLVLILAAALAATPLRAQAPSDLVRIELLPGRRDADGRHVAGLRIAPAPGWKTYWRAPGEAGIPPRFDFSRSRNVADARVLWPVPVVFEQYGLSSIGYADEVVLPIEVRPGRAGEDVALSADVELGLCNDICVPVSAHVEATLPASGAGADAAIDRALAHLPEGRGAAGVASVTCRVAPAERGVEFLARIRMPPLGPDETVVIEPAADGWVSPTRSRRSGDTIAARVEIVPPRGAPLALDRSRLRITVLADGHGVEILGCDG